MTLTEKEAALLSEALDECQEFLEDQADVDCIEGQWLPNKAMRLHILVREAKAVLSRR